MSEAKEDLERLRWVALPIDANVSEGNFSHRNAQGALPLSTIMHLMLHVRYFY